LFLQGVFLLLVGTAQSVGTVQSNPRREAQDILAVKATTASPVRFEKTRRQGANRHVVG